MAALGANLGTGASRALAHTGDGRQDWVVALCDAWAFMAESIEFYNERLLNEAFLGTATLPSSLERLFHSFGHTPSPNFTSSTYVSYSVTDKVAGVDRATRNRKTATGATKDQRDRAHEPEPVGTRTRIKRHSKIGALPSEDGDATGFVTLDDLDAFVGASELKPLEPEGYPATPVSGTTTQLELAGTGTRLKPGSLVLITGSAPGAEAVRSWIRTLTAVSADRVRRSTRVTWSDPLDLLAGAVPILSDPVVYGYPAAATIFGWDSPEWSSLGTSRRLKVLAEGGEPNPIGGGLVLSKDDGLTWSPGSLLLPPESVVTCAGFVEGTLMIGTEAHGLYLLGERGVLKNATGVPRAPILFAGGEHGRLLASTIAGGVYVSVDDGRSWDEVAGGSLPTHPRKTLPARLIGMITAVARDVKKAATITVPKAEAEARKIEERLRRRRRTQAPADDGPALQRLPKVAVRAVVADGKVLVAGTDVGIYYFTGRDWVAERLRGAISSLLMTPHGLVAGTPQGLYNRSPETQTWNRLLEPFTQRVRALAWNDLLVVATDDGVWQLRDGQWTNAPATGAPGLPAGPVIALAVHGTTVFAAPSAGGIYRSADGGGSWTRCDEQIVFSVPAELVTAAADRGPVPPPLAAAFVDAGLPLPLSARYTRASEGVVIDAGDRLFRLRVAEGSAEVRLAASLGPVTDLAVSGSTLAAAAGGIEILATEWPGLGVSGTSVDLYPNAKAAAPDHPVVITQPLDAGIDSFVTRIRSVAQPNVERFGSRRKVTRLAVEDEIPAGRFDPRAASVWVDGAQQSLLEPPGSRVAVVEGGSTAVAGSLPAGIGAGRRGIITGKPTTLTVAPMGGVQTSSARGPLETALYQADVRDIALGPGDSGVVATAEGLFVVRPQDGAVLVAGDLSADGPRAVVRLDDTSSFLIATGDGVVGLEVTPNGAVLGPSSLRATSVVSLAATHKLGTVALSSDGAVLVRGPADVGKGTWTEVPALSAGVRAIAALGEAIYAAGEDGVSVLDPGNAAWTPTAPGLDGALVNALVASPGGAIWALTTTGLWSLSPDRSRWRADDRFGRDETVVALDAAADGEPLVATLSGVFHRFSGGWSRIARLTGSVVAALARSHEGTLWVGRATHVPIVVKEARHGHAPGPVPGIRQLLLPARPRLTGTDLTSLDHGAVPPSVADSLEAAGNDLDGASLVVTVVEPVKCWTLVTGTTVFVANARSSSGSTHLAVYENRDVALALGRPRSENDIAGWPVELHGIRGTLSAGAHDVVVLAATDDAPSFAETFTIETVSTPTTRSADPDRTTLSLTKPLDHVYDATTVTLHLNVVAAARGRLVERPIGSGDPAVPNQKFYIRDPVAIVMRPDGGDPESSLEISVEGHDWDAVHSLVEAGPLDQVYQMDATPDGAVLVRFGDGLHGALLPRGRDNVVASYLAGGGSGTEAGAGELIQPLTRPALVTGVKNPVAALRPATPDHRRAAAATLRTLGRAVTPGDFEDLAAAQGGVESAAAELLLSPGGEVLVVTVAPTGDAPADLTERVEAALRSARGPGCRVSVAIAETVPVALTLEVVGTDEALDAVRSAMSRFTAARPGARLLGSHVLEAATRVAGISSARIVSWGRYGEASHSRGSIRARSARWSSARGAPLPAELLAIDNAEGRLRVEAANG